MDFLPRSCFDCSPRGCTLGYSALDHASGRPHHGSVGHSWVVGRLGIVNSTFNSYSIDY
jgi:hypothetical protein